MTPFLKSEWVIQLHMVIYPVFETSSLATVYHHTTNNEQTITYNHLCVMEVTTSLNNQFFATFIQKLNK